jgi:hypothetical protein
LRRSAGLPPLKYLSLAHNSVTANGLDRFLARLKAGRGGQAAEVHILDILELKGNTGNAPSTAASLAQTLEDVGIGRVIV